MFARGLGALHEGSGVEEPAGASEDGARPGEAGVKVALAGDTREEAAGAGEDAGVGTVPGVPH